MCAFGGFLLSFLLDYAFLTIELLFNTLCCKETVYVLESQTNKTILDVMCQACLMPVPQSWSLSSPIYQLLKKQFRPLGAQKVARCCTEARTRVVVASPALTIDMEPAAVNAIKGHGPIQKQPDATPSSTLPYFPCPTAKTVYLDLQSCMQGTASPPCCCC